MVVVAAGLLLIAGTGMVQAAYKAHKQCHAKLNTCRAKLSTCKTNLSQAQGDLATCNTSLTQSEANLASCQADLAACEANTSAFPATGQTRSFRAGDDGDLEAGATLSYTDNLDGTIIDNNTGLEWEKKSDEEAVDDGDNTTNPHEKDNVYTWENAFAVHVAGLNTANFAGFNDWRLPNVKELQSVVNYGTSNPAVSSEFNNSCDPGDTVLIGSCTAASTYWSSTTYAFNSDSAWVVEFFGGSVGSVDKPGNLLVRAVRGGSL